MKVKKLPKVLEYFDANKDILSKNEGHYLEMMDRFKEDYDDCKSCAESEKNDWKIETNFEYFVERMDEEIDILNTLHRKCIEIVEEN